MLRELCIWIIVSSIVSLISGYLANRWESAGISIVPLFIFFITFGLAVAMLVV